MVARIVEQLGGQLRADSRPNEGSSFSFLIPLTIYEEDTARLTMLTSPVPTGETRLQNFRRKSSSSSEIEEIVEALATSSLNPAVYRGRREKSSSSNSSKRSLSPPKDGKFEITDSAYPLRSIKMDSYSAASVAPASSSVRPRISSTKKTPSSSSSIDQHSKSSLRILVVEVNRMFGILTHLLC